MFVKELKKYNISDILKEMKFVSFTNIRTSVCSWAPITSGLVHYCRQYLEVNI